MSKKPLFWETFFMFVIVGILDMVAHRFNLYWSVYEFDSLVHFLGGALVSFFFLWFYFYSGFFKSQKRDLKQFLKVSLLGILFIGISWEIFEIVNGENLMQGKKYGFDVSLDLIMDLLGALVACFYGYLKELKSYAKS